MLKIAHLSDIHYDLNSLESALATPEIKSTDIIAITGDVAGSPKDNQKEDIKDIRKQIDRLEGPWADMFRSMPFDDKKRLKIYSLQDLINVMVTSCFDDPDVEEYLACRKAITDMAKGQYQETKDLLDAMPQRKLMVHGNWDSAEFLDVFKDWDIHGKEKTALGLKFAGYGGSEYSFNPFGLKGPYYNEDEMHDFLLEKSPNVILTHAPPRKLTDTGNTSRSLLGSGMLRSYIYEAGLTAKNLRLVLSGHSHSLGVRKLPSGTLISNPGNLGPAESEPYGTFNIITLDEKSPNEMARADNYVMFDQKAHSLTKEPQIFERYKKRKPKGITAVYELSD